MAETLGLIELRAGTCGGYCCCGLVSVAVVVCGSTNVVQILLAVVVVLAPTAVIAVAVVAILCIPNPWWVFLKYRWNPKVYDGWGPEAG
jgi:hypothetical protein